MPDPEQRKLTATLIAECDEGELLSILSILLTYGQHLDSTISLPRRDGYAWTVEELAEMARAESALEFGFEFADLLGTLALFLYTRVSDFGDKRDDLGAVTDVIRGAVQKLHFNFNRVGDDKSLGFRKGDNDARTGRP